MKRHDFNFMQTFSCYKFVVNSRVSIGAITRDWLEDFAQCTPFRRLAPRIAR